MEAGRIVLRGLVTMGALALPLPLAARDQVSVSGGPALGRITIEELDTSLASRWRWGWDITVGFQHALDSRLSLGLRASWSEGGGRIEDAAGTQRLDADLQELTAPLTMEVHGTGERVRPFAFAGPAFVWRRRAELAVFADGNELVHEDITSDVDRTGWALTAGAGLELGSGTVRPFVEAQYVHGLSGLDPADPSAEDFVGARSRAFQFRVGLRFGR